MSLAPIQFPGKEKEPSFDVAAVRKIITDLIVHSADEVESEELEIKGWCRNERELAEHVSEACSCIANATGGLVLVGVEDGPNVGRKFSKCPHPCVTRTWLNTNIHNLTHPPVECTVHDISALAEEVLGTKGNNLFVVRVPRTRHISGHTSKGISKIRVGKQCQAQYVAGDDRTSVIIPEISIDDLSTTSIDWGISQHAKHFRNPTQWSDRADFLAQARLLEQQLHDEEYLPQLRPTLAALLLFGKPRALAEYAPAFETSVVYRQDTTRIRKNIVESVRDLCLGENSILRGSAPRLRPDVLKELVVNAFIHRCYRIPAHITIRLDDSSLEIQSPGELLAGLTVGNLINGVPVYRNLRLADGARFMGLCDKIGQGIDLVYRGVLSGGFAFPEFESGNNSFTARLSLTGSAEFSEFVRRRAQALSQLEQIIALRLLWQKESATLAELAQVIQRREEIVERVLEEMRNKGMVEECEWRCYRLTTIIRNDIKNIFQADQM
ncbi:MAG: ATP-binding protein, partial [Mycobacterium sp.]